MTFLRPAWPCEESAGRICAAVALCVLTFLGSGCVRWSYPGAEGPSAPSTALTQSHSPTRFQAAEPSGLPREQVVGVPSSEMPRKRSVLASAGLHVGYAIIGVPRDVVAAVLEPVGFTVGTLVGVPIVAVLGPLVAGYTQNPRISTKMARGITMGVSSPFFFVSDIFCRSFTGDMQRWRWGVHPFPRADHRWFPNYPAFLGNREE